MRLVFASSLELVLGKDAATATNFHYGGLGIARSQLALLPYRAYAYLMYLGESGKRPPIVLAWRTRDPK